MVDGMYRSFYAYLVLTLCVGCQKQGNSTAPSEEQRGKGSTAVHSPLIASDTAPTAQTGMTSDGKVSRCMQAKSNVIRLESAGSVPSQTVLLLKAKSADFLSRCEQFPLALVDCLAGAQKRSDLGRCKFENDKSIRPDPELMDLCDAAYDNARNLIVAAGAPGPVLVRYDERRPEALIQCSRERRAVVECLIAAKSMSDLTACRDSIDGSLPTVPDSVKTLCLGIYKRVFAGGAVPKFFHEKWSSNRDGFVVECSRMPSDVRECMSSAKAFSDFQACAVADERKDKKRDGK